MPGYSVRAPNGRVYNVSAPAGASRRQVIGILLQQNPDAATPARAAARAPSAPSRPTQEGRSLRDQIVSNVSAGVRSLPRPVRFLLEQGAQAINPVNFLDPVVGAAVRTPELGLGYGLDVAGATGSSAVAVPRMIAGATAGIDSDAYRNLLGASEFVGGLRSDAGLAAAARGAQRRQEAEGTGFLNEVGAGIRSIGDDPTGAIGGGLGSLVGAAPAAVASLAAGAAGVSATIPVLVVGGVTGAFIGAGSVKEQIFNTVQSELQSMGVPEDRARAAALQAQAYGGENTGDIAIGALVGALANAVGVEGAPLVTATSRIASKLAGGRVSSEVIDQLASRAVMSRVGQGVGSGFSEGITEGIQGGQEQYAANRALQNEGFLLNSAFDGVGSAAGMEGAIGALLGGGAGAISSGGAPRPAAPPGLDPLEEAAARNAVNVRGATPAAAPAAPVKGSKRRAAAPAVPAEADAEAIPNPAFEAKVTEFMALGLPRDAAEGMAIEANIKPTLGPEPVDAAPVGRTRGRSVLRSNARSGVVDATGAPAEPAAGDMGVSGEPAAVNVQGESPVDGALTAEPIARPRRAKPTAAVAPTPEAAAPTTSDTASDMGKWVPGAVYDARNGENALSQEALLDQLDFLQELADRGKLTPNRLVVSAFGKTQGTNTIGALKKAVVNDPVGLVSALRERAMATAPATPEVVPTPTPTPPRTPRAPPATTAPKPPAVGPATDDLTRAEAAALVTAPDVERAIDAYKSAEGSLPNKTAQFQARLQQASRTQTGMLDLLNEVDKETESLPKAAGAPVRGPLRKFSFEDAPVATDATPSNPAAARAARRAVEPTATAEVAPVEPIVEPVVEPSVPVGDLRKSAPVKERAATYTAAVEKRAFLDGVAQQQALAQTGVEPVMPAAASENVRNAFKDGQQVAWGLGAKKAPVAAAPAAAAPAPTRPYKAVSEEDLGTKFDRPVYERRTEDEALAAEAVQVSPKDFGAGVINSLAAHVIDHQGRVWSVKNDRNNPGNHADFFNNLRSSTRNSRAGNDYIVLRTYENQLSSSPMGSINPQQQKTINALRAVAKRNSIEFVGHTGVTPKPAINPVASATKAPLPAERRAAAAAAPQPKAKPAAQVRAEAQAKKPAPQVQKTDAELIAEFEAKRAAETKAAPKPAPKPKAEPKPKPKAAAPVVEQPRVVRDTPDVISEKHEDAREEVSDAEDRAEFRAAVKRARKANLLPDEAVEDINSDLQERGEDGLENARSTAVSALEDNESALIDEYEDDKANIMDTIIEDDLSDADKAALADHFGHKKYSKKTYGKFVDAVVDFVFNGVNAANAAIQSIINGAASAALAIGLVFNPMVLSPPTGLVTKPEIVASLELRATVPTDAANSMSDAAERVYERMAPVATRANVGFMIMDKPNGELHLFRKDGSHIVSTPALSGLATGDEFSAARKEKFDYRTFADNERVTPAGVFTAKKGQQDGTRGQTSTGEQTQGLLLWLSQEGDAHLPVAIHTNYMPERQQYIDSPDRADNAVSFGCISMDADFYADVFEADIDQFDRNLIFVMPNDTARTEEFLPGVTEDVVMQAGGVQDQLSETPLQDDLPMAPPKQQARAQAQAQRRTGGRKGGGGSTAKRNKEGEGISGAVSRQEVEAIVADTVRGWKNAPKITVVDTSADVPNHDGTRIKGAHQSAEGVHIVVDTQKSAADVRATVFHEVLGHAGLQQEFGKQLASLLQDILDTNPAAAREADRYAKEMWGPLLSNFTGPSRRRAMEEVLAHLSESGMRDVPAYKRVLATVKDFFRRWTKKLFGKTIAYSDADVVAVIRRGQDNIVKVSGGKSVPATQDIRYSKANKPVPVPAKTAAAVAKANAETAKLQAAAKKAVDDPQAKIDATANLLSALEAGKANNLENYVPLMKAAGTDIPVATHRALLPLMTLDGIVDWVKDKLPPAERINVLIQKRTGQYAKYMEKAVELSEAMTSYFYRGGKEAFTDAAYHARLARVDLSLMVDSLPDSILADPVIQHIDDKLKQRLTAEDRKELKDKRVIRAAVVTEAYKKWSKVDPEGRALYKKLVNYYSTMYAAMRYYTDKGIAALALPPKLTAEIRAAVEDVVNGGPDEPGVLVPASVYPKAYIPWRRYGEYSIRVGRVKNKLNRDAYADGAFAKYETAGERDAALAMLKNTLTDKDGKKLDPEAFVKRVKQRDSSEELSDSLETQDQLMGAMITAIKEINDKLKNVEPSEVAKVANKLKQDLKNIYLRALPENSIFKQSMKARNVIGMDMDILKVFNSSARQYSSLLTESGSRDGIKRELEAARALIDGNPDTKEQAFLNRTLDELKTRATAPPDEGLDNELLNTLNRAGFQYFLTTPASAAAQWTVIPISVVPRLSARYGDIKANALWAKYTATLPTIKVQRKGKDLADGFTTPSMRDSKHVRDNPVLKRAFDALADRAVFETQSAAIMHTSKTLDSTSFVDRLRRFGRRVETVNGFMFSTSDMLSKQMGAMMFFEAEYNKTKDFDKALEEAVYSSNLRAGNYTQAARPRIMQNDIGRTAFLFKIFPVSVMRWQATMFAEMSKAFKSFDKSLDEDTKKAMRTAALEALRENVGSTLAGSFFHGARGFLAFKAVAAATGFILKSALDDEDKRAIRAASPYRNILDTPDQWFIQDFLPSKFGAPQMLGLDGRMHSLADILAYGIATELSGADIGSRTGLSDLLYREGRDAETFAGKTGEFLLANVAVLGMLERASEGLGKVVAGETMYDRVEGATNVLPSNVSAMLKAALLGVQGVESRANKTVVDPRELNAVDIVSQFLGFQPSFVAKKRGAVYADVYVGGEGVRKANAAKAEAQGRLNRALTDRQGNRENVLRAFELIRKHNNRYPMGSATITEESLNNSYKAYVRANRESYRGQRISKRDLQYLPEAP